MARPKGTTKYDPVIGEKIALFKSMGCSDRYSSEASGISHTTLQRWRKQYPELEQLLCQSVATGVVTNISRMNSAAARGNIQAIQYLLVKLAPDEYKEQTQRIEIDIRVLEGRFDELSDIEIDDFTNTLSGAIKLLPAPATEREA